MTSINTYRKFLKSDRWGEWAAVDNDQKSKIAPPTPQKPFPADATLIELIPPNKLAHINMPLIEAIRNRKSRRKFNPDPLSLEQLSFKPIPSLWPFDVAKFSITCKQHSHSSSFATTWTSNGTF